MNLTGLVNAARAFLEAEVRNVRRFDRPWRHRLWLYRNGFLSSKDAIWDLTEDTVDLYLSDLEYRSIKRIDRPYSNGLKNKVIFHLLVSPTHNHLLPEVYGLVRDGRFVDAPRLGEVRSFDELVGLLEDEPVVAKPVTAAKGDGVRVLESGDGGFRIDGRSVNRTELIESLTTDRELLLSENVGQAEYAAEIYPKSTNTLRILTMIDPETDEPFIAAATHRFGTSTSGRVDNWSAGGVSAGVDIDTGELGTVVSRSATGLSMGERAESHPDTGAQITGISVPGWGRVKETVLGLAGEYGSLWPYVGWDVVVRNDRGAITVLEGEPQSVDADQQAHGPLLADDRVRRFCEHHGVLSERTQTPT